MKGILAGFGKGRVNNVPLEAGTLMTYINNRGIMYKVANK